MDGMEVGVMGKGRKVEGRRVLRYAGCGDSEFSLKSERKGRIESVVGEIVVVVVLQVEYVGVLVATLESGIRHH